jgi:hypothetical protein
MPNYYSRGPDDRGGGQGFFNRLRWVNDTQLGNICGPNCFTIKGVSHIMHVCVDKGLYLYTVLHIVRLNVCDVCCLIDIAQVSKTPCHPKLKDTDMRAKHDFNATQTFI